MGKSREALRQEMLENYTNIVDGMEKALSTDHGVVLSNASYIVTVDGIAFNPEIKNGKVAAGPVRFGLPHLVQRFSKEDAERVAKSATNGHGHHGIAVYWVDATKEMLGRMKLIVQQLKENPDFS